MTLLAFLNAMCDVERGVAITQPQAERIRVAYPLLPSSARSQALTTPCTMHNYRRIGAARVNSLRRDAWGIRLQVLVAPRAVDSDKWSVIAAAFDEALIDAFDADVRLSSANGFQRIVDEQSDFQPGLVDWNGLEYIGLQYEYRIDANVVTTFS